MIIFNFTYFLGTKFSKSLKSKFTYWKSRNGDFPGPVERQSRSARLLGALWNRSQLLFQPKSTILNFHIFKFIYFNIYFVVLIFKSTDFGKYAKSQNTSSTLVFYQYGEGVSKFSARMVQHSQGNSHFTFRFWNPTLQPAYLSSWLDLDSEFGSKCYLRVEGDRFPRILCLFVMPGRRSCPETDSHFQFICTRLTKQSQWTEIIPNRSQFDLNKWNWETDPRKVFMMVLRVRGLGARAGTFGAGRAKG